MRLRNAAKCSHFAICHHALSQGAWATAGCLFVGTLCFHLDVAVFCDFNWKLISRKRPLMLARDRRTKYSDAFWFYNLSIVFHLMSVLAKLELWRKVVYEGFNAALSRLERSVLLHSICLTLLVLGFIAFAEFVCFFSSSLLFIDTFEAI